MLLLTLSFLTINVVSATVTNSRYDEKNEMQNTIYCKSVCEDCHCRGFYCGEECICECDGGNEENVKCLATMHNKCKKLQFPFEVLIQGPSGNRFMRKALLFEEIYQQCLKRDLKNKRNTVVLYKPPPKRTRRQSGVTTDESPPNGETDANADSPIVGSPLALALPAVRARTQLTTAAIRARYEAGLARIRARLAARLPLLLTPSAAGLLTPIPPPPLLPVQPVFTL